MEDRYLFKARGQCSKFWHYGMLTFCGDCTCHIKDNLYNEKICDTSTLCQCTGKKDKNDKLIWENDIVKDKHGNFYKVFWQNNYYQFSWICVKSDVFSIGTKWDLWSFKSFEIEVIGNIFDNKELLESEE